MLISLGGLIGVGKTTVLNELKKILNNDRFIFIEEPVDIWTAIKDKEGNNALECFYNNPHKHAISFQILAFITRLEQIKLAMDSADYFEPVIITERSLEEDRHIFAEYLHESGFISDIDYEIYKYWFDNLAILPDLNIILKLSPEQCLERIINRARKGEDSINLHYLSCLEKKYFKMTCSNNIPACFIDCNNRSVEEIAEVVANRIIGHI
jgi:thymidylate kinase